MKNYRKLFLLFFLFSNAFLFSSGSLAKDNAKHPCVAGDQEKCDDIAVQIIENRMLMAFRAKIKPGGIKGLMTDKDTCAQVNYGAWWGCQTKGYYDVVWPEPPPPLPPTPPKECKCGQKWSPQGCLPKRCNGISVSACATVSLECKALPVDLVSVLEERTNNPILIREAQLRLLSRIEQILEEK